ncbi:Uncharacterised protein [Chlamydia trachomatis]|nr:Uncharacterised protein [Chlamydia trachomatis]
MGSRAPAVDTILIPAERGRDHCNTKTQGYHHTRKSSVYDAITAGPEQVWRALPEKITISLSLPLFGAEPLH